MEELFQLLETELLGTFTESHDIFHLQNVKYQNNQMLRMEQMNQFLFPTIFVSFGTINWQHLGAGVRYSLASFTLNIVIENYIEMEGINNSKRNIDVISNAVKNKVESIGYVDDYWFISTPWLINETRGTNESNLISMDLTFNCNLTDFTMHKGSNFTNLLDLNIRTAATSKWILKKGFWADLGTWDDLEKWID